MIRPLLLQMALAGMDGTRLENNRRKVSSAADAGADANVAARYDDSAMASTRLTIMDLPDDPLLQILEMARRRRPSHDGYAGCP